MRKLHSLPFAIVAALLLQPSWAQETAPASPAAAAPSTLPGGAKSLSETHGDWTVDCGGDQGKQCTLSQSLADSQNGQHVLTLELTASAVDQVEGMLVTPFGLSLAAGVKLGVDGKEVLPAQPFLTCIPSGCLVPVSFDGSALSTLRAGTKLTIDAISADGAKAIPITISLTGFTRALNRTLELAQQ